MDGSKTKNTNLVWEYLLSIVSGILSACLDFGIDAGKHMADTANDIWKAANPATTANFFFKIMLLTLLYYGAG